MPNVDINRGMSEALEVLRSEADKSRVFGSVAGVAGIIGGAIVAGPLAATVAGISVGLGGAVLAGAALTKKLRLDKRLIDVRNLEAGQQKLLADRLDAIEIKGAMGADAVERIVAEVSH